MSKHLKSPDGKPSEDDTEYAAGADEQSQLGVGVTPNKRGLMDYFRPTNRDPPQETKTCSELIAYGRDELLSCFKSVQYELSPPPSVRNLTFRDVWTAAAGFVFIPQLPAFKNPGWLTNYGTAYLTHTYTSIHTYTLT